MKAWSIKKWNATFEVAATRKLRNLDYIGVPLDQGSLRFRSLMQDMIGAAAHGHFMAIVQWAAGLPCRGLFVRSGRPLTVDQIACGANIPPRMLRKTWTRLTGAEPDGVGWIEEVEISATSPPQDYYWSAADPPPTRHEVTGTPLALNPPNTPVHPKTPTPNPHPDCGGAGPPSEQSRADAYAALTARPWPDVNPGKAKAVSVTVPVYAILAAVRKGRAMNSRKAESCGAGLLVHWIETGEAEKFAEQERERQRKASRAKWDRTPAEAQVNLIARYCGENPGIESLNGAAVAATDAFIDWLEADQRPTRRTA